MAVKYWQAKIWGILHDPLYVPIVNALQERDSNLLTELGLTGESLKEFQNKIKLASNITSASDHSAVQGIKNSQIEDLKISHLLSGAKLPLELSEKEQKRLIDERSQYLQEQAAEIIKDFSISINDNNNDWEPEKVRKLKRVFWWLWRCLPEATIKAYGKQQQLLIPADPKFPDSSVWSNSSLTAAVTGALVGYKEDKEDKKDTVPSHPYLVSFTFSPIQELIKASRKMRDFWAGSWLLHYLSATVSWKLAQQYGPDCLLYPNLYQQPLIDNWLLKDYPDFSKWFDKPSERSLLTAGFPNVIVIILPGDKVQDAMQTAKNELLQAWRNLGQDVLNELQKERHWMTNLKPESRTWKGWLESQWQTYWSAVPIGTKEQDLETKNIDQAWIDLQNKAYDLVEDKQLLLKAEREFFASVKPEINIGSWWANIFDQTRLAVATVKNARDWEIPTAFGPRSTVSGLGPVVHLPEINPHNNSQKDWVTEGNTKKYWKRHAGLFDGIEQLNATETLKRGLHQILPKLLNLTEHKTTENKITKLSASYPDLTVGIAGYLQSRGVQELEAFHKVCKAIKQKLLDDQRPIPDAAIQAWGIPFIDEHTNSQYTDYHPRLLNAGWLVEELEIEKEEIPTYRGELQKLIDTYYPKNNPTDWYVLAAGDGDGMSDWLKGTKMQPYSNYIAEGLKTNTSEQFKAFLTLHKRMGPSTHNALSRALLDFSNQLVPYLTETRYAGRLIYGGGDDVLAYTNLWEWDSWLWDIRQCFKGDKDPGKEFENTGDYWKWNTKDKPKNLANRPLFTMGSQATISFGIVIAHHSVPLAIALENLWETEGEAKKHKSLNGTEKDALQVRVIYGNGNTLKATTKFDVFDKWKKLINFTLDPEKTIVDLESSLFEQAAMILNQHPIPCKEAIQPWVNAFCSRREQLKNEAVKAQFPAELANFLESLWYVSDIKYEKKEPTKIKEDTFNQEAQNWFKLAAFIMRTRKIDIKGVA